MSELSMETRVGILLLDLMNRKGFGAHIGRKKGSEGGTYSIEHAFFADSGSSCTDEFPTLLEALEAAVAEQDEVDEESR